MKQGDVYADSLAEFFEKFNIPANPDNPSDHDVMLARKLILDEDIGEVEEVRDAFSNYLYIREAGSKAEQKEALAHLAKELGDLIYVVFYACHKLGIPMQVVFNRIHKSNLSKLDDNGKPIFDANGKVMKGPNYKKPDILSLF